MDPLSDVLSLLKPRGYVSAGLDAGGEWAIRFPAHDGIKFNAVIRGCCWVVVDAHRQRLDEGDCFLLTRGRSFTLATDPAVEPIESGPIYDTATNGVATCNGGGDFFLVGGRFAFANTYAFELFGALPPIIHLPRNLKNTAVLRWSLEQFASEVGGDQPGGALIAEHLAHIMLVQALRLYLDTHDQKLAGLFYALSNRQIGHAVTAMHADPARHWTLSELASLSHMSRSTFSEKFRQTAGVAPMEYLTRWRMLIAADRLCNSTENLATIAASLGYESESAFSTAFRRTMRSSPRQYQRLQTRSREVTASKPTIPS